MRVKGEPVFEGVVFRLAKATSDGRMLPNHFELSSADRESSPATLSVWESTCIPLEHADQLTEQRYDQAGYLPVEQIRELRPHPDDPVMTNLDVVWEPLQTAGGHCGIVGVDQRTGTDSKGGKLDKYRKSLRGQLAELANSTRVEMFPPRPRN